SPPTGTRTLSLLDALPIYRPPGQLQLALQRLVGVGVDAQRDRTGPVAGPRQLPAQKVRGIGLGEDLRLEDQARRQVEVGVRWPRSEEHTSELQSRENIVCR